MASFPPGQSRISQHRERAAHVCACVFARRNFSTLSTRWQLCHWARRANGGSWRRTVKRSEWSCVQWTACQHEHEYGFQGRRCWRRHHHASILRVLTRSWQFNVELLHACRMHHCRNAILHSPAEMSIHEKGYLRAGFTHACNFALDHHHAPSPPPYRCIVTCASHGVLKRCLAYDSLHALSPTCIDDAEDDACVRPYVHLSLSPLSCYVFACLDPARSPTPKETCTLCTIRSAV